MGRKRRSRQKERARRVDDVRERSVEGVRRLPEIPLAAEAVLAWVPDRDSRFSLRAACATLAVLGHRNWDVGRVLRTSGLFRPTMRDASLPEGYQATRFRLTDEGQSRWDTLHADGPPLIPRR